MIQYLSTRGQAGRRSFEEVLLAGLAEDGGLFVPEAWPSFAAGELRAMRGLDYPALAAKLLAPFTAGCFDEADLLRLARRAYAGFDHPATAPLRHLAADDWLLELFHGPTLAFKDFAMQLLAAMFDEVLARRGERVTIVGATSGDTGAAAVHAFAGKRQVRDRDAAPARPRLAGAAPADDHRAGPERAERRGPRHVRRLPGPGEGDVRRRPVPGRHAPHGGQLDQLGPGGGAGGLLRLGGAAAGRPDRPVAFAVPTGNFGNVYAGRVAAAVGLPVARLVVATNENDILARFLATRRYERGTVQPTTSPSMDIQVASNFERLLLELEGHDAERTRGRMHAFAQAGGFALDGGRRPLFAGGSAGQAEVAATIAATGAPRVGWSTRTPPSGWPSPPGTGRRRACRWSRSRPPTPPSSPRRSRPPPACARRCPRATPT